MTHDYQLMLDWIDDQTPEMVDRIWSEEEWLTMKSRLITRDASQISRKGFLRR